MSFKNYVVQNNEGAFVRHWHLDTDPCKLCHAGVPLDFEPQILSEDFQVKLWGENDA